MCIRDRLIDTRIDSLVWGCILSVILHVNKHNKLVESGNTMVIIEHNLDVIKTADWIIGLGPEGGDGGGDIVAIGTPEKVAKEKRSWTGKYLKPMLARG